MSNLVKVFQVETSWTPESLWALIHQFLILTAHGSALKKNMQGIKIKVFKAHL